LIDISIDNLLLKSNNKFILVNAASARAKQIIEGSLPYIEEFDPNNPIITALKEISVGRIKFELGTEEKDKKQKAEKAAVEEKKEKPASVLDRLSKDSKKKAKTKSKAKKK